MENLIIPGAFLTAMIITWVSIPSVVTVAKLKGLCEKPNERRLHVGVIPTLGGCAVFAGFLITAMLFCGGETKSFLQAFAASAILLFFVGIKDDILEIAPLTKLLGQITAAALTVIFGDVRIESLDGIFGLHDLPYWISVVLSIGFVISIINAYNLIDGVDGLAGLLSITAVAFFSIWFYLEGVVDFTVFGICFIGAMTGFLRHNMFGKETKIFMGDTGSMLVGFMCSVMAMKFMQCNHGAHVEVLSKPLQCAPIVAVTFMIVPVYDVLRVMFIRFVLRKPIMQPDNHHIHYRLKSLGLKAWEIDLVLVPINIIFAYFSWQISQSLPLMRMLLIDFLVLMAVFHIPQAIITIKKRKQGDKEQL
ncbi:MAG: undecaprenyl/decaprenyl-phosphate alpha-N-acetylglucosaminyl 1-phosphate transferase [Bacteroidales bacterium]|nr:undecaprenyl/decaprenyl-phosphate alpha-N-acetylglucosaminyl 1-phosphate transferase [Bacteroidales bacterium]